MTRPWQEIVNEIVSTGLTQLQLALLLELVSAMSTPVSGGSRVESPDSAIERRREWDRKYRRKRRLLEKLASTSASTRQSTRQVDTPLISSSLTDSQFGNREEVKKEPTALIVEGQKPKVSRGTRLTPDWQPSPELVQFARDHGVDPVKLRDEFVDYWIGIPGQRGVKTNWAGTWRNRVRALGPKGASNGHRLANGARKQSGSADFFAGLAEVAANISGHGPVAGAASEEIPLGRINLDG